MINNEIEMIPFNEVERKIKVLRGQHVLLDRDVAELFGVKTRVVNQTVRNNPGKFLEGYVFELTTEESSVLRSNNLTLEEETGRGRHSKYNFKTFSERGLYMLATILKSRRAELATIAIIETFHKVRQLKNELVDLHREADKEKQKTKMQHFGEVLTDIVMPDLQTSETESLLEINYVVGKIKHRVKRVRRED